MANDVADLVDCREFIEAEIMEKANKDISQWYKNGKTQCMNPKN